jgi:hypothetical protein
VRSLAFLAFLAAPLALSATRHISPLAPPAAT